MPERFDLGGASFHLVVSSAAFNAALTKAEADARAASQKIAAALAGVGRGSAGATIAPKIDIAPAQRSLAGFEAAVKSAKAAAAFTATPKVDTRAAESQLAKFGAGIGQGLGIGGGAAVAVGAVNAVKAWFKRSGWRVTV